MKNNFSKIAFLIALTLFIIPQVTLAAWWNPFTWKIFSSKNSTEIHTAASTTASLGTENKPVVTVDNSKETLSCNGQVWSKCPSGQKFVCPTGQGDAYCEAPKVPQTKSTVNNPAPQPVQQQIPIYTNPPVIQVDMSKETALKNKAVDLITQEITAIKSLDDFFVESIEYMTNVRRDNLGFRDDLSVSTVAYTDTMLGRNKDIHAHNQEMLTSLRSEINSLQSQPLSYFSTYQIPQTHYDVLAGLPKIVNMYVDQYNTYVDSISTGNNLRSQIKQRTHCSFNGIGSGGLVSIDCY